jgi:phosphoribosylaminoimidazole-succinocarboxamide synthase
MKAIRGTVLFRTFSGHNTVEVLEYVSEFEKTFVNPNAKKNNLTDNLSRQDALHT